MLDIGGGWGAFVEYGGRRGLRVTSLTISEASRAFVQDLIDTQGLPCEIRREHLFDHRPDEPYDAIVNLGVTEHLPDYPRTLATYLELLKPGGRVYLDASAARRKNWVGTFVEKQLFPGNGSPLALASYVKAVSRSPLELELVINDRVDYGLTARHWAENLDAARDLIEERFGIAAVPPVPAVPLGLRRRLPPRLHPGLPLGATQARVTAGAGTPGPRAGRCSRSSSTCAYPPACGPRTRTGTGRSRRRRVSGRRARRRTPPGPRAGAPRGPRRR